MPSVPPASNPGRLLAPLKGADTPQCTATRTSLGLAPASWFLRLFRVSTLTWPSSKLAKQNTPLGHLVQNRGEVHSLREVQVQLAKKGAEGSKERPQLGPVQNGMEESLLHLFLTERAGHWYCSQVAILPLLFLKWDIYALYLHRGLGQSYDEFMMLCHCFAFLCCSVYSFEMEIGTCCNTTPSCHLFSFA